MRFESKVIHAGQKPDPQTGAVIPPVYQTSTYRQDGIGKNAGYEYSRTDNPTRSRLQALLASLEGGRWGLAFASGMAASAAVFSLLKPGEHVIAGADLYGGTYRFLEKVLVPWGLEVSYADPDDGRGFEKAVKKNTRLIWVETPTNPLLKVIDLGKLSGVAEHLNLLLAVDNTFATPYLQKPLACGADLVVHSTTKYLSGHSDIIGGGLVTSNPNIHRRLKFYQNAAGAVPGPWDCWLTIRGMKTLPVRMREHEKNALFLAQYLHRHPQVAKVYYPGLPDSPYHALASRQMEGFGAMISLELEGGFRAVERFVSRLKFFSLAESLGGVESLVCYPPAMTHAAFSPQQRARRHISDSLVRLSVGIEHKLDLRDDLARALAFSKV